MLPSLMLRMRLLRFLSICLLAVLVGVTPLCGQQPSVKEVYQDFRGSKPLLPAFQLEGPDLGTAVKYEEEGLRITLPATRMENRPVYVATTFIISGDFEITATYDLIAADTPTKGYGVGVSLTVSPDQAARKFARVARLMRPQTGSRFVSEYSSKDPPKDYKILGRPTEVRSGQLRLRREGPKLLFLVSEAPGKEFLKVYEQEKFGTEDLDYVRFNVTDGNTPGYAVEARLVDLRIRFDTSVPGRALAPRADPATEEQNKRQTKGWLAASLLAGTAIILCLALAAGAALHLRRRREDQTAKRRASP